CVKLAGYAIVKHNDDTNTLSLHFSACVQRPFLDKREIKLLVIVFIMSLKHFDWSNAKKFHFRKKSNYLYPHWKVPVSVPTFGDQFSIPITLSKNRWYRESVPRTDTSLVQIYIYIY